MKPAKVVNKALVEASDCPRHPKYQALRPPTSKCETCQAIYDMSHEHNGIVKIKYD